MIESARPSPVWPSVVFGSALIGMLAGDVAVLAQHTNGHDFLPQWFQASAMTIVYGTVGWFIARRVPGHRLGGVMLGLAVATTGLLVFGTAALASVQQGWPYGAQTWLGGLFSVSGVAFICLMMFVVLLAPTGRPINGFYRVVCWFVVITGCWWGLTSLLLGTDDESLVGGPTDHSLAPDSWLTGLFWSGLATKVAIVLLSLLAIVGQVLRYRRSRGDERRQVTWVVGAGVAGVLVLWVQGLLTPRFPDLEWLSGLAWTVGTLLLPLGIAVAVLRHGLYELDNVVSRTVSYTIVTGGVLLVYIAVVAGISQLAPQSDNLAVAAATLAAAATARPLLRRVRDRVDKQFNRARFDHAVAVAGFSNQMQNTVDPARVQDQLLGVLHRTLQPRSVTVWLRSGA